MDNRNYWDRWYISMRTGLLVILISIVFWAIMGILIWRAL